MNKQSRAYRQQRKDIQLPADPQIAPVTAAPATTEYSHYNPAVVQIQAEIAAREAELEHLRKACEVLTQSPRIMSSPQDAPKPAKPSNGNGHNGNGHASAEPETVADAVEGILRETGRSMHAKVLLNELAKVGKATTEKNLINTLNRWVKRRKKFHRPGPNTFALQGADGMKGTTV